MNNLQGKIKTIAPIVVRGDKNFKTRKIILDRTSEYEGRVNVNHTEITLLGDRADLPEAIGLNPGDIIKCDFNVKGRFFQHEGVEKFAQDVEAWNIQIVQLHVQPRTETPNAGNGEMP